MNTYLKAEQVNVCFSRLASRKVQGKSSMERTSALMYFFSLNAILKSINQSKVDLNPTKSDGANNRKRIELEFTRLVLLENQNNQILQVCELGKIDESAKSPEKRISSNFLTVPLKKASEQNRPFYYPQRPAAPLIKMGLTATGIKWGMEIHEDWKENLPKLFTEMVSSTIFTDLAIFLFRDFKFGENPIDYIQELSLALKSRFTIDLAEFWVEKIRKEKVLVKHIINPFAPTHESMLLGRHDFKSSNNKEDTKSLKERIEYLEKLLNKNQIPFLNFNTN
jgi:hypothetical protein